MQQRLARLLNTTNDRTAHRGLVQQGEKRLSISFGPHVTVTPAMTWVGKEGGFGGEIQVTFPQAPTQR
jgi:hypothetical protein